MKNIPFRVSTFLIIPLVISWSSFNERWHTESHHGYLVNFTLDDDNNVKEYVNLIDRGVATVEDFFHHPYITEFKVYIHPDRKSLDSTWQQDWKMPGFQSECWMVASGVAERVDMISPKSWIKEACEHAYSDTLKTQRLITHELVHVFHGQHNQSPDFSDVTGLDWFVEGVAVYASGQCDSERMADVTNACASGQVPKDLASFWSGNLKYGFSGSMVMYIDHEFGREKLISLLKYNHLAEVLAELEISEDLLIRNWRTFMQ